jgi:hypothetical protein
MPRPKIKQAFAGEVKLMVHQLLKIQGFVIIGTTEWKDGKERLNFPWRTTKLWQYEMDAEYEAYAPATVIEWEQQSALIAKLRPNWIPVPKNQGLVYFKVRPV